MKKKIILIGLTYTIFIIIAAINNSCFIDKEEYICNINLTAYQTQKSPELPYQLKFMVYGAYWGNSCSLPKIKLTQSCYAFTQCVDYQNELVPSTFEILFDKPIYYKNDTIPENTNLLKVPQFADHFDIETQNECSKKVSYITFDTDISEFMDFEGTIYVVLFKCTTSDGRNLSAEAKLQIKQ